MGRSRPGSGTFPVAGAAVGGGRFELLERIGVGGIAEIHRARLSGLDGFSKIIALKVLRPELASERTHRERFGIEARLGALLEHPNIAAVHDFVEVDGRPTIVMEWRRACARAPCCRSSCAACASRSRPSAQRPRSSPSPRAACIGARARAR